MNIAIIGCGNIAKVHVQIIARHVRARRLVFCDADEGRARRFAESYGPGAVYQSIDELLDREKVDAAHILTPPPTHSSIVKKVLTAGAHVYVEKPGTEKAAEYLMLHQLASNGERVLCVGYSMLGLPAVRRAKALINSGRFGRLISVHCDYNWSGDNGTIPYGRPDHWAYGLRGGILENLADHPTSLVVDAMDEPQNYSITFAHRQKLPNNCPDLMHLSLSNDHQIGSYTLSFGHGNTRGLIAYSLEAATIVVDLRRELVVIANDRSSQNFGDKALSALRLGLGMEVGVVGNILGRVAGSLQQNSGIVSLVGNFYHAIDGSEPLIVNHETVASVTGLLESAWTQMGQESRATKQVQ